MMLLVGVQILIVGAGRFGVYCNLESFLVVSFNKILGNWFNVNQRLLGIIVEFINTYFVSFICD